jgi:hypothetical protein
MLLKFILVINLSLLTLISRASTELTNNHCIAKVNSKKYIDNDFQAPYPKTITFKCDYICKSSSRSKVISAISNIVVSNTNDDAKLVVCQGVKVKKVSWGWDYAGVEQFYAYSTNLKEIKKWAFQNVPKDNPYEVNLLYRLKETLMEVANGYYKVGLNGFEYYHEAARTLSKIANELPSQTSELDKHIKLISNKPDMLTARGLVSGILTSTAQFRTK